MTRGLMALVEREATTPEGRARLARSLKRTLRSIPDAGCPVSCPNCPPPFATIGVANALDGLAAGLGAAAESARHVADHARVILPPR